MDTMQFEQLRAYSAKKPTISVSELSDPDADRTLLWGYTVERLSFHVYLEKGLLNVLIYDHNDQIKHFEHGQSIETARLSPDKRAYPEACDFEFCQLMKDKGQHIPFTTFQPEREPATFYGKTRDTLSPPTEEELALLDANLAAQKAIQDHYAEHKGISPGSMEYHVLWRDKEIAQDCDIVRVMGLKARDGERPEDDHFREVSAVIKKLKDEPSSYSDKAIDCIEKVVAMAQKLPAS